MKRNLFFLIIILFFIQSCSINNNIINNKLNKITLQVSEYKIESKENLILPIHNSEENILLFKNGFSFLKNPQNTQNYKTISYFIEDSEIIHIYCKKLLNGKYILNILFKRNNIYFSSIVLLNNRKQIIWEKIYNNEDSYDLILINAIEQKNNIFLIGNAGNYISICKINIDGRIFWNKKIYSEQSNFAFISKSAIYNNNLILTGTNISNKNKTGEFFILKFDLKSKKIINQINLNNSIVMLSNGFEFLENKELLVFGSTQEIYEKNNQFSLIDGNFILKLNNNFEIIDYDIVLSDKFNFKKSIKINNNILIWGNNPTNIKQINYHYFNMSGKYLYTKVSEQSNSILINNITKSKNLIFEYCNDLTNKSTYIKYYEKYDKPFKYTINTIPFENYNISQGFYNFSTKNINIDILNQSFLSSQIIEVCFND